jgi:hypothetical protein
VSYRKQASKKTAAQDCFARPLLLIYSAIDFRPDDISYPPVQPV